MSEWLNNAGLRDASASKNHLYCYRKYVEKSFLFIGSTQFGNIQTIRRNLLVVRPSGHLIEEQQLSIQYI